MVDLTYKDIWMSTAKVCVVKGFFEVFMIQVLFVFCIKIILYRFKINRAIICKPNY